MNFSDLDKAYRDYKKDPDTINDLFNLCLKFAKISLSIHISDPDREDVAQDCAWTAWTRLSSLRNGLFGIWFFTIVVNKRKDYYRKKYAEMNTFDKLSVPTLAEDNMTFAYGRLKEASGTNHEIIDLALAGMTYSEIGTELGISEASVTQRIFRMKQRYLKSLNTSESELVN